MILNTPTLAGLEKKTIKKTLAQHMNNSNASVLITGIEIYKSKIKLKEPFVISLGLLEWAENIIVVIRTDKDITGFGECSPFMTINGESMDTCFIVGQYLAKILAGKNALDIENRVREMDALIYGNSSIKSAFDIALHDIASQHEEVPLYRFLGGKNNKTLTTDYTVSFGEASKMATDADKIKKNGFTIIKVKLGGTKEDDLERIRVIRNSIGPEIPLRLDANQGWDTDTAIDILKKLEPFNIQVCEEPIPRWNYMELSKIKKESPIPIMADESCCDHHDAKRLIDLKAVDCFNIKTGKSSGLYKAKKIIELADANNIKMQIGGFLESRLGFTAAAHLALSSENIIYYDFDAPLMFEEDPVTGGIAYSQGGIVKLPDGTGLGATIDHDYLKKLEQVIIK